MIAAGCQSEDLDEGHLRVETTTDGLQPNWPRDCGFEA
jgi:hypothetical protein